MLRHSFESIIHMYCMYAIYISVLHTMIHLQFESQILVIHGALFHGFDTLWTLRKNTT
jgi:hypothetical protein